MTARFAKTSPKLGFKKLLMGSLMLSCTLLSSCAEKPATETPTLEIEDLQLRIHPGGARILTGRVKNLTEDLISSAQIQVTLFDEDNRAVTVMSVVVHDIPAAESILFREAVDSDFDVRGARVKQILVL